MLRVENKAAIVTGGSPGIGKSSCTLPAKEGAIMIVTDKQQDILMQFNINLT